MQYEIQASLLKFLEETTGLTVVWVYDGVTFPTEKPFITIEQIQNNTRVLDKAREVAQTIYHFQVGIFAKTAAQRAQLQDQIKELLIFNEIPLLNVSQPDEPPVGFFTANVDNETPIWNDDISQESVYHRVYLDVSVAANLYKE